MNWKKLYREKWPDGKRRAEKILSIFPVHKFKIEPFGFMTDSIEYSDKHPDEPGIPDYKITILKNDYSFLLETTGTQYPQKNDPRFLWIRNDKFEYAENHKNLDCWLAHIIESYNLIGFFKLENKEKYVYQEKFIRGIRENFRIIRYNNEKVLYPREFLDYLYFLGEL